MSKILKKIFPSVSLALVICGVMLNLPSSKVQASDPIAVPVYMVSGTPQTVYLPHDYPYGYIIYNNIYCPLVYLNGQIYYQLLNNFYPISYR